MTEHRDEQAFTFIESYIKTHGYAPEFREIATGIGASTSTVHASVQSLALHNRITIVPGRARTMRVVA